MLTTLMGHETTKAIDAFETISKKPQAFVHVSVPSIIEVLFRSFIDILDFEADPCFPKHLCSCDRARDLRVHP